MENNLFTGKLVRLAITDPQTMAKAANRWARDSEYWRLMAADPAFPHSVKSTKEWIEKEWMSESSQAYSFAIFTLADNCLIGDIGLEGVQWNHGDCFVGISIGERENWGKGYGTDAMRLILRYAFTELNLHRVTLNVFEYNPRAIRSYEKAGYSHEGCSREFLNRDGRRYDLVYMGILRAEWEQQQASES